VSERITQYGEHVLGRAPDECSGAAGNKTMVIMSVTPLPISASDNRSEPVAAPTTAIIKMAEVVAWLTNSTPCSRKPPPRASATTSAISTATATDRAEAAWD
jgi:hypothetical protein